MIRKDTKARSRALLLNLPSGPRPLASSQPLKGTEGRTEKQSGTQLKPQIISPFLATKDEMNMKNTGRPKKETTEVKDIVKHIRYSAEEWETVQGKLESSGLSYSEFIRRASFRVSITPVNMEAINVLRDTRTELVRIGNNINQIARHGATVVDQNSLDLFIQDLQKCNDMAKELSAELQKIKDAIK